MRAGMTTSGGPKYFLKGGDDAKEFVFFISSGDDVAAQRDLFDAMVRTTDNQFRQRRDQSRPFTLVVDRWESCRPRWPCRSATTPLALQGVKRYTWKNLPG